MARLYGDQATETNSQIPLTIEIWTVAETRTRIVLRRLHASFASAIKRGKHIAWILEHVYPQET